MPEYDIVGWPKFPELLTGDNQPDLRPVSKRCYRLNSKYSVRIQDVSNGRLYVVCVPAGFQSDGASVPRVVWTLVGLRPDGPIRAAALIHDYIYRSKGVVEVSSVVGAKTLDISRKNADRIFLSLMRAAGMGGRANIAYWAVRSAFWKSWH